MRQATVIVLYGVLMCVASAYFHEKDIYNECIKSGKATKSTWNKDISCSEMKAGININVTIP